MNVNISSSAPNISAAFMASSPPHKASQQTRGFLVPNSSQRLKKSTWPLVSPAGLRTAALNTSMFMSKMDGPLLAGCSNAHKSLPLPEMVSVVLIGG